MQSVFDTLLSWQVGFNEWTSQYDPEGLYSKIIISVLAMIVSWVMVNFILFTTKGSWSLSRKALCGSYRFFFPIPVPETPDPQMAALEHCLDDPEAMWDDKKLELLADNLLIKVVHYADKSYGVKEALVERGNGENILDDLNAAEKTWLTNKVTQVIRDILERERSGRRLSRAISLTTPVRISVKALASKEDKKENLPYDPIITETLRRLKS